MAREKEKPQEVEEAPPPKKGKKKIILIAVAVLVLLGGGAFTYFLFSDDPPPEKKDQEKHSQRAIMTMEAFLVNLADKDVRRYLKVKIDLEVENEKALKELEKFQPRIRDQIIFLLSSKTYQDIATPEGKSLLKKEVMAKMTAMPMGKKITAAYFTEFVAQ
jgi:flagellar FliL protein